MQESTSLAASSHIGQWFDNFIDKLREYQVKLEMDDASQDLKSFFEAIFSNDINEINRLSKAAIQQHFVKQIVLEYVSLIKGSFPNALAFDFNDSEVLVWAEITDDNESLEKKLILAEAKINSKYHIYGFDMTSTIVEARDKQSTPSHYISFVEKT